MTDPNATITDKNPREAVIEACRELVQRGILLTMNGLASALRNSG